MFSFCFVEFWRFLFLFLGVFLNFNLLQVGEFQSNSFLKFSLNNPANCRR
ncbi:Uncharacterized protein APZ42_032539 [Daphnia magna]|uniref:Uncharacterized protein n=1 Tax=Daphnia magna TaxID=35525 RepID=A0A164LMX6_9CRUS|nr:Uncharacterized protein APZ42_032539 [Daphnia magna]